MTEIIKSPSGFPDWFFKKDYNFPNTTRNWTCEINLRVFTELFIQRNSREDSEKHLNFCFSDNFASSVTRELYPENGDTIIDMPIIDALILNAFIWKPEYQKIIETINLTIEGMKGYYPDEESDDLQAFTRSRWLHDRASSNIYDEIMGNDFDDDDKYSVFWCPAYDEYTSCHSWLKNGELLSGKPISVNLACDDETLKKSFAAWLKTQREESHKSRKPFTISDYEDWQRFRILQVFDLDIWAEFYDKKITDAAMAKALWPDGMVDSEEVSPIDRLRKVSRDKLKKIINPQTVKRLWAQLDVESLQDME
ncbi:MAG: DUF6387 family protein [Opitutae bacterium]